MVISVPGEEFDATSVSLRCRRCDAISVLVVGGAVLMPGDEVEYAARDEVEYEQVGLGAVLMPAGDAMPGDTRSWDGQAGEGCRAGW